MGRVTLLDHTADVGLRIDADSLDELFATAAAGLIGYVVANPEAIAAQAEESVSVAADTLGELLVGWLNEIVFLVETTHRVYRTFDVQVQVEDSVCRLKALLRGEPIDPARHQLDHEVKAVTHHLARIEHTGEGWLGEVILDI